MDSRLRRALPPAALLALVLAFYGPALGRYFTSEDFLLIRFLGEHPPWRDLRAQWTAPWLGITVVKFYRPVATLLYGLEIAAFGARPLGYNLVHVLIHAGNAVLVFAIARRLGRRLPGGAGGAAPLLAAALFALYPLHPNAVVFSASFATLFGASFLLAAFLAWQRFRDLGGAVGWSAAFGLFLLALGSYEAAAVFPALIAAHDHLLDRPRRPPWKLIPGYLPFFGVLGLYLLLRRSIFGVVVGGYDEYSARLLVPQWFRGLQDLATSIEKLHLPAYGRWPSPLETAAFCSLVLLLPLAFFLLARRRLDPAHLRAWLFAWSWTVITQTPFAFRPSVPGNGRYWYLAAFGIALSAGLLARAGASVLPSRWRLLPYGMVAAFGLFWGWLLAGYIHVSKEAGRTAAAIQAELVRIGTAPGAPRRLFLTRYPYFLADTAQVFHYGLRDSVHPPFVRAEVPVYPLPPLPDAELLPVAWAEPQGLYAWDEASGTVRKVAPRASPGLRPLVIVSPLDGETLDPIPGEMAVEFLPGRPGERFRLILVSGGNATVADLRPEATRRGAVRAELPADFVLAMDRLYGGDFFWWIEARDAAGNLAGFSRLRSFRVAG